ncbi:MAG: tetratricopeptide repeat protein, partial [Clostridiaceae bacterium]|nr:tetratricopeptide repeat protein [Clostridiaceae bacterium]
MKKWNMQKIVITSVLTLLVIMGVGLGGYKYTKNKQYNALIKDANSHMENSEYDKAIDLYKESLSYKTDTNIQDSINLAQSLIEENKVYDEGIILMSDKKFLEAIDQFKKIGKDSGKLYTDAQNKINESNKEYVALNISKANIALEANNYDEANNYIAQVFKIDNNNENAGKLKDTIAK